VLARGFDFMLEKLSNAHAKLMERSYKWGKAEMASGVLHNLRNSLSPVVTHIDLMREDINKAPLDNIHAAQEQLAQPTTPPERRVDLQRFLELAGSDLESLCRKMKTELDDLAGRAMHIERILGTRDLLINAECPVEATTIQQLTDDSKKLMHDDLCKRISIEISPGASKIGRFECDKISVSQIFANLLINAAESIRRAGIAQGRISVDAVVEKINSVDMLHIRMTDNGGGIAPQDIGRIFERGFTTKPLTTNSGVGLHWCANAAGAMGGRMWAQSDNLGHGACIHLLLPLRNQTYPKKEIFKE
ncbi:MAG: sensor histidine kinase, partial [Sedimentisphaerales bacterium]|nr:sensor histidine kinase [Sedimentisphaerales bacterium]